MSPTQPLGGVLADWLYQPTLDLFQEAWQQFHCQSPVIFLIERGGILAERSQLFVQCLKESSGCRLTRNLPKLVAVPFFQRGGYERNPVASRNNTVARLLAITDERMDVNSAKPGAQELAAAF